MRITAPHTRFVVFSAILATFIGLTSGAYAFSCPPKGPVATGSRMTVVYDPVDTTMKACVNGSWVTMAGSGGGGGNLDSLSDVIISSPANNQVLLFNGSNWVNSAVTVSESDPQVGTLTANQWCAANAGGTAIDCNQAAPSGGSSSGTAGYIQFSGGSGAFANSGTTAGQQLFWDNTNKRLFVGAASSAYKFFVQGSDGNIAQFLGANGVQGLTLTSSATNYTNLRVFDGGGRNITITSQPNDLANTDGYLAAIATGLGAGLSLATPVNIDNNHLTLRARGDIALYTNAGSTALIERMRVTSAGNVGIGETSPASNLHVKGSGDTSVLIQNTGGNVSQVHLNNTAAGGRQYALRSWGSGSSGDFSVDDLTASARRLTISSTGNVGVATATPAETLDVNGTVKATTYKGLASNFTRITATVSSTSTVAWGYSSYVACPAGYTLINYGIASALSSGAYPGAGVSYHDCNVSGNSVRAAHFTQVVNANFYTTCFGLCVRD